MESVDNYKITYKHANVAANLGLYAGNRDYKLTLTLMKPDGTKFDTSGDTGTTVLTYRFITTSCADSDIKAADGAKTVKYAKGSAALEVTWTWTYQTNKDSCKDWYGWKLAYNPSNKSG